jgi:hypothetical protein
LWWLKADAGVTQSGGTASAWADQSGNGYNATAPAGQLPFFIASNSAINNMPSVRWASTDTTGNGATGQTMSANVPVNGLTDVTIIAVAVDADPNYTTGNEGIYMNQRCLLHWPETGGWGQVGFGVFQQFVCWRFGTGANGATGEWGRTPVETSFKTYTLIRSQSTDGKETLYVNGVQKLQIGATAGPVANTGTPVNIGMSSQGGTALQYWSGDVAEIIMYSRALTAAEQAQVEAYLTTKYFVTVPQPTVAITSPTSTYTATVGTPVSFTAAVTVTNSGATLSTISFFDGSTLLGLGSSNGSGGYTYQWNTAGAAAGNHNIIATVLDSAGGTATSAPVVVSVSNSSPPSITLTAPTNGFIAGAGWQVALSATTTNGTPNVVTGVEFLLDGGTVMGHGTLVSAGVYSFSWDTLPAAFGAHTLRARAIDGGGLMGSSASISVVIRIPGDGNGDNIVDGEDYGIWQNGYQHPGATIATGDYNGDGIVDGEDYGVWQNNYNRTVSLDDVVAASSADVASTPMTGAAGPQLISVTPSGNTVALVFDSDVVVGGSAVEVTGLAGGPQAYAAAYDAATRTLTLTFAAGLPADSYTVRVIGSFVVAADGGAALADAQAQFTQE